MKLELTEHDIFLLKLAGSALIALLAIRFLVMPGVSRLQENTIQNQELEETVSEMSAAIDSVPALEQTIEARLEELRTLSGTYYERMENRQVDELLTGLALKHGLFPVSLDIEGAAPSMPAPYLYGGAAQGQDAGAASEGYVLTASGRMVLSGEESRLLAFVGDVEENYPAIRVWNLRRDDRVYFDDDWNMVEQPDMSCELAIYMYDWTVVE